MNPPVAARAQRDYPVGSTWDEAFAPDGSVRPHYQRLLEDLSAVDLRELCGTTSAAMRASGVTFGDDTFPLDPVPRLIEAAEWRRLEDGIVQRGRALAEFVADVYGERRIVAAGAVPDRVIEDASGFEPWMMGVPVCTAGFLAGLDLVRGDDGELRVLEDNTRTPSGIAYAAAARRALDAHLPTTPPPGRADPLEAFDQLAAALERAAPPGLDAPCVALLSDGASNSAWYEHRQIAARLSIPIVTPRDLSRRNSSLWAWIDGRSRRVDVILRRTDEDRLRDEHGAATWLADLLLDPVRRGALTVVNPLGSGVADDKVVHAYVEEMIRLYLGEEALLRSVPTLDLGDPHVLEQAWPRLHDLVIKPRGGSGGSGVVVCRHASREDRARAAARVSECPSAWAAQETITFSTHPTACARGLEPRHVDLRPFAIGGDEQAVVAAGALTRVAFGDGALVVNSSQSGGAKDTWVPA